jgi:preprotein translocase subunit Sec61beta
MPVLIEVTSRHGSGVNMSSRRKKGEKKSPMPAASAGLLRFFEEETEGIKVRPELLMGAAVALIVICVLADIFF